MSPSQPKRTIDSVVAQHLCLSCGTCVSVCPQQAITMMESPGGLLLASIHEAKCNQCGLCFQVCPGGHLVRGGPQPEVDPFTGTVIAAYCGHASDTTVHRKGQSGGVATAILCHLLESGSMDRAIVTQMPKDGSLRPTVSIVTDRSGVLSAQGSQYCPVALNAVLTRIPKDGRSRTAIVGLPCHFHGLWNLPQSQGDAFIKIGLICDRMMSLCAMDMLISKAGTPRQNISSIHYRDKLLGGWPGDVGIYEKSGNTVRVKQDIRHWCKGQFTPPRCFLCFDKMNFFCDIVLGDAWGVRQDKAGHSVILARTDRGRDVIESARKAGVLVVEPVDPERVFQGQKIEKKRLDWTAYSHCWREMGNTLPDLGIQDRWKADLSAVTFGPYSKQLRQSMTLTTTKSSSSLLASALTAYRMDRFRQYLSFSRWISAITKRINRLKGLRG